ncbi:MAG: IS1 family transposase [Calditrichaeota bacterium]|nr:IS1 family transposase [Calditrichota bacterium]
MNLDNFSCQNPSCPDHNKTGAANINLYTRYGRKQVRLLICKTCGRTFSELKGTPFWDSRLDWDTIEKIYRSLLKGSGIRATAREFNLSKNTVKRYLRLANKDYQTVLNFLQERGVVSNGDSQLRELLNQFSSRRQASDRAGMAAV